MYSDVVADITERVLPARRRQWRKVQASLLQLQEIRTCRTGMPQLIHGIAPRPDLLVKAALYLIFYWNAETGGHHNAKHCSATEVYCCRVLRTT